VIERAHGGVLFLDEIGELPPEVQVKLLRFLEERVVTRLGGKEELPVDIQVVAATNADLSRRIREGRFREDLYYRLKVAEIRVPPLRERIEDIPLLADHFLGKLGRDRGIAALSEDALDALRRHAWPGNVRELRNALEAGVLKAGLRGRRQVEREDLPEEIRAGADRVRTPVRPGSGPLESKEAAGRALPLEEALARAELEQVERALVQCGGKKTEAWKLLGLNDRFVFARRVRRLCRRFPGLVKDYPGVEAAFGEGKRG